MDFVIFILKRPLMSLFIFVSSFGLFMLIANTLTNKEYENAIKNPNKIVKCGIYKGVKEVRKTNLHRGSFYRVFVFDGESFTSDINLASFNLGKGKYKKPENLLLGDRVCLTISNGLIIKFNIQK